VTRWSRLRDRRRRLEKAETLTLWSGSTTQFIATAEQIAKGFAPQVRRTDPETSVSAAVAVQPGTPFLVSTIRRTVELSSVPLDAFDIAAEVVRHHPNRWQLDTVRTRVSGMQKAGLLVHVDNKRRENGRLYRRYSL
jgi:hypothetical protein